MFLNIRNLYAAVLLLLAIGSASAQNPTVNITNQTGKSLKTLLISSSTANWGNENKLAGTASPLKNGASVRIALQPNICIYDLQAVDASDKRYILWEVNLCNEPEIWIAPQYAVDTQGEMTEDATPDIAVVHTEPASELTLNLHNKTGFELMELYVSSDPDHWGQDLLGDETLNDGTARNVQVTLEDCIGFVKAIDEEGEMYHVSGRDFCEDQDVQLTPDDMGDLDVPPAIASIDQTGETTAPDENAVKVSIKNELGKTIFYLYAKPEGGQWSKDLLGASTVLSEDETLSVGIPGLSPEKCVFSIAGTDLNDTEAWVMRDVNLCGEDAVSFKAEQLDNTFFNEKSPQSTDPDDQSATENPPPPEMEDAPMSPIVVSVQNRKRHTVFYLYMRLVGTEDWGSDRLGAANALSPRESADLTLPEMTEENCHFDVRGTNLKGEEVLMMRNVNFCEGGNIKLR